jgi:hypothetical protein
MDECADPQTCVKYLLKEFDKTETVVNNIATEQEDTMIMI